MGEMEDPNKAVKARPIPEKVKHISRVVEVPVRDEGLARSYSTWVPLCGETTNPFSTWVFASSPEDATCGACFELHVKMKLLAVLEKVESGIDLLSVLFGNREALFDRVEQKLREGRR